MIQLLAAGFAVLLFAAPLHAAPAVAIAWTGIAGLAVATPAIAGFWRWPATAAAAIFLGDYAAALWISRASVDVVSGAAFGLALCFLLESVDLACRLRGATSDGSVIRAHLLRWGVFTAGTLLVVALAVTLARALASVLPSTTAPLLAAAASLGTLLSLAWVIARAQRHGGLQPPSRRAG
jgi:hypothetical protein